MSEFILPDLKTIVDPISESECTSLGNNTGLNVDDGESTCEALEHRLLPLLSQVLGSISSGTKTIFANEDSKCSPDDENPTLASMLSRIYRVSQAFTCILCQYDPSLSNLLLSGSYPQVLMGKPNADAYPIWVSPDNTPIEGSHRPITSNGVYQAINNAILSVWHLWDKGNNGSFSYYVTDPLMLPTEDVEDGEYAIVYVASDSANAIFRWDNDQWTVDEIIPQADMQDFAVVHIEKGAYADKGLYWFDVSWNILDADMSDVEQRIAALEQQAASSVGQFDNTTKYEIGVVADMAEAATILPETGKTKIVFIED